MTPSPNTKSDTANTSKILANKPVETTKPADVAATTGKPVDPKPTEVATTPATTKDAKSSKTDKRRILSVNFPSRTVKQLKLLASVEGVTVASIVVASVTRTVAKRLPGALDALKADVGDE